MKNTAITAKPAKIPIPSANPAAKRPAIQRPSR